MSTWKTIATLNGWETNTDGSAQTEHLIRGCTFQNATGPFGGTLSDVIANNSYAGKATISYADNGDQTVTATSFSQQEGGIGDEDTLSPESSGEDNLFALSSSGHGFQSFGARPSEGASNNKIILHGVNNLNGVPQLTTEIAGTDGYVDHGHTGAWDYDNTNIETYMNYPSSVIEGFTEGFDGHGSAVANNKLYLKFVAIDGAFIYYQMGNDKHGNPRALKELAEETNCVTVDLNGDGSGLLQYDGPGVSNDFKGGDGSVSNSDAIKWIGNIIRFAKNHSVNGALDASSKVYLNASCWKFASPDFESYGWSGVAGGSAHGYTNNLKFPLNGYFSGDATSKADLTISGTCSFEYGSLFAHGADIAGWDNGTGDWESAIDMLNNYANSVSTAWSGTNAAKTHDIYDNPSINVDDKYILQLQIQSDLGYGDGVGQTKQLPEFLIQNNYLETWQDSDTFGNHGGNITWKGPDGINRVVRAISTYTLNTGASTGTMLPTAYSSESDLPTQYDDYEDNLGVGTIKIVDDIVQIKTAL